MLEESSLPELNNTQAELRTVYFDSTLKVTKNKDAAVKTSRYYVQGSESTTPQLSQAIDNSIADEETSILGVILKRDENNIVWSDDRVRHADLFNVEGSIKGSATFQVNRSGQRMLATVSGNNEVSARSAANLLQRHYLGSTPIELNLIATIDSNTG